MSKSSIFSAAVLPTAALAIAMWATSSVVAQSSTEAARLDHFAHPDGTNYFALSLRPPAMAEAAGPRDVVVLFDTSASQTADYRTKAIAALRSALSGLDAGDRVHLMAVDLNAAALTESFVSPGGPEMGEGLKKLDARVPSGSTDMEKALTAASDNYAADSQNGSSGRVTSNVVIMFSPPSGRGNIFGSIYVRRRSLSSSWKSVSFSMPSCGSRAIKEVLGK